MIKKARGSGYIPQVNEKSDIHACITMQDNITSVNACSQSRSIHIHSVHCTCSADAISIQIQVPNA